MKLANCGLDIQVKSMSYDDAMAHSEEEFKLVGDGPAMHRFRLETLAAIYGRETADKLKADNGELMAVYKATIHKTWGREGEEKNS